MNAFNDELNSTGQHLDDYDEQHELPQVLNKAGSHGPDPHGMTVAALGRAAARLVAAVLQKSRTPSVPSRPEKWIGGVLPALLGGVVLVTIGRQFVVKRAVLAGS